MATTGIPPECHLNRLIFATRATPGRSDGEIDGQWSGVDRRLSCAGRPKPSHPTAIGPDGTFSHKPVDFSFNYVRLTCNLVSTQRAFGINEIQRNVQTANVCRGSQYYEIPQWRIHGETRPIGALRGGWTRRRYPPTICQLSGTPQTIRQAKRFNFCMAPPS